MTDEKRALQMYELALSLVQAKGVLVNMGLIALKEYSGENLTIHYLPKSGHLDVWCRRKVLTIDPRGRTLKAIHYAPGEWEEELEEAAAKPPSKR